MAHFAAQQEASLWWFFTWTLCTIFSTKRRSWVKLAKHGFSYFSSRGNRFGLFTISSPSILALSESQLSNSKGSIWPQASAKLCSGQNGRWCCGKNARLESGHMSFSTSSAINLLGDSGQVSESFSRVLTCENSFQHFCHQKKIPLSFLSLVHWFPYLKKCVSLSNQRYETKTAQVFPWSNAFTSMKPLKM